MADNSGGQVSWSAEEADETNQIKPEEWEQDKLLNPIPELRPIMMETFSVSDETQISSEIKTMFQKMDMDPYSEDEAELRFLHSKPTCFIILGKPGVGKTTMARQLANEWNCQLINSTDILQQNMELHTEMGLRCMQLLSRGEAVPEEIVIKMIQEKIDSLEVAHHGYVLDDFPCMSEDTMTIKDQLEMVKSWKLKPDFIVNIKMPDKDLEKRRLGQKLDPLTAEIYTQEVIAPKKPIKVAKPVNEGDESEEEGEEGGEEEEIPETDVPVELPVQVLERLIRRPEDMPEQVEAQLSAFRTNMLRLLEDYMADHNPQYLVELDGNQLSANLIKQVLQKLNCFIIRPAAVVSRLHDAEEEEIPEEIDTEDLMRTLAPKRMIAPRFRWRRSRWLRYCPVALHEGNKVPGKPEFAVSFLDKVYCLSSHEAMGKFLKNPRPYLLPPQPRPPCKLSVIGPPLSGKTTLCHILAQKYGATVLNVNEIIKPRTEKERFKMLRQVEAETKESSIIAVKTMIKEQMEAEAAAREEAERLAAEEAAKEAEERALLEAEERALLEEESESLQVEGEETEVPGESNKNEETVAVAAPSAVSSKVSEPSVISSEIPSVESHAISAPSLISDEVSAPPTVESGESEGLESGELAEQQTESEGLEMAEKDVEEVKEEDKIGESAPEASGDDKQPIPFEPDVDETHPEVIARVKSALEAAESQPMILPVDIVVEEVEIAIHEWEKKMQNNRPNGPINGGWILDNFPATREQWSACVEKGLLPDDVILLSDTSETGLFLVKRFYLLNEDFITSQIEERLRLEEEERRRLAEEQRLREEEEKRIAEEEIRLAREAERLRRMEDGEIFDEEEEQEGTEPKSSGDEQEPKPIDESEAVPNENEEGEVKAQENEETVPKVHYDNEEKKIEKKESAEGDLTRETSSMLDIDASDEIKIPECIEIETFQKSLQEYEKEYSSIAGSIPVEPITIEIERKKIEAVFEEIVENIEKPYTYQAWEYAGADADEDDEDIEASGQGEEEEEEEEEEDETQKEENQKSKKPLGDFNHFCPVALKETGVLYPGNPETAARYREKNYYFSSTEAREKFLANPEIYMSKDKPPRTPPLRLLILGPRGSGKSMHARHLADKLGIFHIMFKERLQELIISKTKKKIGPEYEDEKEEEEPESDPEDIENTSNVEKEAIPDETKEEKKLETVDSESKTEGLDEEMEMEMTEDEEMIKASLENNDSLPPEVLDNIVPQWWLKEPFKSTGFILEGFPRTSEEAQYLSSVGLFPDAVLLMTVRDEDVVGRLLPPKLDKWKVKRDKRLAKLQRRKEKAKKKREEKIQKRREELLKEREERRAEQAAEKAAKGEDSDEEAAEEGEEEEGEEEEEENIEDILAEEFEEEEEEEDVEEELEEDAVERMRNEMNDVFDDDTNKLEAIKETLDEMLVPKLEIPAGRKPHIVRYIIKKKLKPYVDFRASLFERVYPINESLAYKMIQTGYKQPSRFAKWCPVKLLEGDCIQPMTGPGYKSYPCLYRQHIYFLSTPGARESFRKDPVTYLKQPNPKPVVPIRMAIIGPPKSGKTTIATRFVEDFGVVRLSIGEAMRTVLQTQPNTELVQNMNTFLLKGLVVPDELQVAALEVCMLDMHCHTRGYILDGYPMTKRQVELMTDRSIIPVRVFVLDLDSREVMVRGARDRFSPTRVLPLNDSVPVLHTKLLAYQKMVEDVIDWYKNEHMNVVSVDASQSKWRVMDFVLEAMRGAVQQIQTYLYRIDQGKAASIADMCITPKEFQQRLGDYGQYCPVSLALNRKLVDCSTEHSLKYAAEFRGYYYKLKGEKELEMFLKHPEKYVPPEAPHKLPPPELLPQRLQPEEMPLKQVYLQGYCPVTFLDGKCRYEALVPGNSQLIVQYRERTYFFETEEKLLKFMSFPEKYWDLKLPHKLPPQKDPLSIVGLPMLGYLEQGVATSLITSMAAVGNFKPKYPFISSTRSAILYLAYHLKAFNPKSSDYVRKKYKQKLKKFEETCNLIRYLGDNMTIRYREPVERPSDFDSKLEVFFALKGIEPTPTWIA